MWITEYIDQVECDFHAIYHIPDMRVLDGPTFIRFACNLIYYAGAVQGKLKSDYSEHNEDGSVTLRADPKVESTQKVKMSDAMKQYGESDDLDALNMDSEAAMGGTLFERVTVPGN